MWCGFVIFCIVFAFVGVGFQLYIMLNDTMENVSKILKRLEYLERWAIRSDKHFEELDRTVINAGELLDSIDKEKSESIARLWDLIKDHIDKCIEHFEELDRTVINAGVLLDSIDKEKSESIARLWDLIKDHIDKCIEHFEELDRTVINAGVLLDSIDKEKSESIARLWDLIKAQPQPGATYIRWGRSSCPENASALVYHGIAAGSSQNHKGAAANHLCLPTEPTYGSYYEDEVQHGGLLYGTTYYFATRSDNMKFFPGISATAHLHTQTVPCALCHVERESMIMVSAKNVCPAGWTVEYHGLLVSGMSHDKGVSNFICLDAKPETAAHVEFRVDTKRLYLVEGTCDSLPCPPFVRGRELTCVVCTK